ncbi:MAG: RadC family protein [Bacillota bacterium]
MKGSTLWCRMEEMHEGHRKRHKERYLTEGLEGFKDHEVLELLLYYSIPRRDTNEIAHTLLKKFGSLNAVLDADPSELEATAGVGIHSAILLSLVPAIARRYDIAAIGDRPQLDSTARAGEYAMALLKGIPVERFYLICLDAQCRVTYAALLQEGTINQAAVYPRMVVETALRHRAHSLIIAHNHPGGALKPSKADIRVTRAVMDAVKPLGIDVLDHIIVAGRGYFSFAAERSMTEMDASVQQKETGYAAEPEK